MIVLNKWRDVMNLLEKKSTVYSDRPSLPIFDV